MLKSGNFYLFFLVFFIAAAFINAADSNVSIGVVDPNCGTNRNVCVGTPPQYCNNTYELTRNCSYCGCSVLYSCNVTTQDCYFSSTNVCFDGCMNRLSGNKYKEFICGVNCAVPYWGLWIFMLSIVILAVILLMWVFWVGKHD